MIVRPWILLALAAAAASGCDDAGVEPSRSDPHPPRTDDERLLATRYREFVHALERRDADGVCRQLDRPLAESYGCGSERLRIPRELRGLEVPANEVFAAIDPSVAREIQVSARSRRSDGAQLILVYRQGDAGEWRIRETMVGFYG